MPSTPTGPRPLDLADLTAVLNALGARVDVDPSSGPRSTLVLHLAHGLVGAAEQNAITSEMAAREAGAGVEDVGRAAGDVFAGAACQSALDALALIQWRMTR